MTVKESTDKARETIKETFASTRTRAEQAYESAAARTGEYYSSARERARETGRQARETVDNHPLAAVVGGLGLGLLIGALLPRTRRETELLGPYGSQITGRARDAARAARDVGKEHLDELGFVKETAKDTAKKVIDGAKTAASEAGKEAARTVRGGDE